MLEKKLGTWMAVSSGDRTMRVLVAGCMRSLIDVVQAELIQSTVKAFVLVTCSPHLLGVGVMS